MTTCPRCGAPFTRFALLDDTLIPYEPHPRGTLTLSADPVPRLLRIRDVVATPGLGWKRNDPSKFKANHFPGERFVSHFTVCTPIAEESHVR